MKFLFTKRVVTLNNEDVLGSLFMIQVDFDHAQIKQKALLLVQYVDTRWNNIYYARETEKAKIECPVLCG